jgi:four helix bundle protein
MGARRYQDLEAWRLANEMKRGVYALVDSSPASQDLRFWRQIKAAASSATANITEGFASYRHPEFVRYLRIARCSLIEAHNHRADGADRGYWTRHDADRLEQLADRVVGAVTRLMRFLMVTKTPT